MKIGKTKAEKIFAPLIFLIVFSFGLIWAAIVPANNEAPDEASHVNMIYFLKNHHRAPVFNREEEIHPTIYDQRIGSGAYYSMAYNSPLSYLPFIPISNGLIENVSKNNILPMRIVSALFIGLFALFLFMSLRNFEPKNPILALAVTLLVVFIPQVIFTSGYINIEPFALLISAISFYFLSRVVTKDIKIISDFVWLGFSLGILGLCKANYLFFVLFLFLILLIIIIKSKKKKQLALYSLLSAGIFLLLNLWWWIRNISLYGDPLITGYIKREILDRAPGWLVTPAEQGYNIFTIFERTDFLKLTFLGFFANLGGASILLPKIFYMIFFLLVIVCLFSSLTKIKQNKYSEFVLSATVTSIAAILYFAYKNLYDFSPQGRHLFPLLIPLALVVYFGINKIKKIWQKIICLFLIIFGVFSSFWGLWLTVDQYYVRGIAYSNFSNSGKIVTDFSWRVFSLKNYEKLFSYIFDGNPPVLGQIAVVIAGVVLLLSLAIIFYRIIKTKSQTSAID